MEIDIFNVLLLLVAGVAAGFINTVAGGGGLFTLAALLFMGIPADLANGTNRVSVAIQSLEGVRGFHQHNVLDTKAILPLMVPTLSGSLIGSVAASWMPVTLLKPLLLATMVAMALLLLLKPTIMTPKPDEQPKRVTESRIGWVAMFGAGLYGGFIQGGVGFLLLASLVGVLHYSLVAANALKLVCTAIFGAVALTVFVMRGQVLWIPGIIISIGTLIGVHTSVKFAVRAKHDTLRHILLVTVIGVCIAAYFR